MRPIPKWRLRMPARHHGIAGRRRLGESETMAELVERIDQVLDDYRVGGARQPPAAPRAQ